MVSELRKKAGDGVFWSAVDTFAARLVQFVIGIILARLLLPEQFGLIGMLAIFMAVAQSLLDSGFGSALIQRKEITAVDSSSVFYFNVVVGVIMAGLLSLVAPWIAVFYEQPVLTGLMRAMSLVIVINSFGAVQSAMLIRNLNFKVQAKVSVLAGAGSGAVGVFMAYRGMGVWSLAIQQVCNAVFSVALLWVFNSWRPCLAFSFQSLRQMFAFGSRLLISGLLSTIFNNIYLAVIGKLYTPAILGFYTRAKRLQDLPASTLTRIVTRVSFPVFASIHDDIPRLKRVLRKSLCTAVFGTFPVMAGLTVAAEPVVKVLLTDKWLPCVPYLQLLTVLGLFLPLQMLNLNALLAMGHSDLYLRLEILKKSLTIVNIVVMSRWGVMAMIWGQVLLSVVGYLINSYYVVRLIRYTVVEQVRDVSPYLACGAVMAAAVYGVGHLGFSGTLVGLILQILVGIAVYLSLCGLLRLPAFLESAGVVRKRLFAINWRAA